MLFLVKLIAKRKAIYRVVSVGQLTAARTAGAGLALNYIFTSYMRSTSAFVRSTAFVLW